VEVVAAVVVKVRQLAVFDPEAEQEEEEIG
jgi:hypothetical protein